MDSSQTVYIPLGIDCSIAYNLRKYKLSSTAFPFDWLKIPNIDNIVQILENDFADFLNPKLIHTKSQSQTAFDYFDNTVEKVATKSYKKLVHTKYKYTMPHEFVGDVIDWQKWYEKYSRRITRFRNIAKDPTIKKIFIRLDTKVKDLEMETKLQVILSNLVKTGFPEVERDKLTSSHHTKLEKALVDYCKGDLALISIVDLRSVGNFTWKREHINWLDAFKMCC